MNKRLLIFALYVFSFSISFSCKKEDEVFISTQQKAGNDTDKNTPTTIQNLGRLLFYAPIMTGEKDVAVLLANILILPMPMAVIYP